MTTVTLLRQARLRMARKSLFAATALALVGGMAVPSAMAQSTTPSVTQNVAPNGPSSVADLARWDAALATDRLLPEKLMSHMFSAQAATPDGAAYGLGWFLRGPHVAYHTGETIGFRSAIVRRLDARLTAIVLTNRNEAAPLTHADTLIQLASRS